MHEIQLLFARKGDGGFNPTRVRASKGDAGFRRAGRLVYRTQMRYPWAAVGPGRATSGRPTLQTSSNQHDLNRLAKTSVTNVVNLSPKTSIFTEKADGLTTFVTTGQKSTRKTPWIDDVCNNTRCPVTPTGSGGPGCGARGRQRGLSALRADAQAHVSTPGPTGVEGAGGHERAWLRCPWAVAGPGCGARGRWQGLAGLRDDAPSEARGADGERAGRRPRAHKAARPTGQHARHPEHQRGRKHRRKVRTPRSTPGSGRPGGRRGGRVR